MCLSVAFYTKQLSPVLWHLPINLGTLGFKTTWFNRNTILWQTFHKLWILLTRVIEFGTLTEGLAINWQRYNLSLLQLEQVNCCLLGGKGFYYFCNSLNISLTLCSTQINTLAEDYLSNKTRKLLENSNMLLFTVDFQETCISFVCNRDTSISLLSGLLNSPASKGTSNCFSLCIDQDKQQGLLLWKRLFSYSGVNMKTTSSLQWWSSWNSKSRWAPYCLETWNGQNSVPADRLTEHFLH